MKITKRITALIMVFAIATTAFTATMFASPAVISVREAAVANDATVAWDAARGAVIITRADSSTYTLVVGEHGSFNDSGTIFAPVTVMERIFAAPAPVARTHNIHGGLHRIEHAGSVAYIFGSLHGGLEDWFPLADIVEDAMRRADVFAFEIDFSLSEDEVAAIVEDIMLIPDGQTIADILSEELYEHYIAMMTDWANYFVGVLDDIYYTNPAFLIFALQSALMSLMADIDVQGDGGVTVDDYVMGFATENGRTVIGLMDFEAQQRVVLAPPHEILLYTVAALGTFSDTVDEMRGGELDNFNQLVYYYVANNAEALARELHRGFDIEDEHPLDRYFRYVVLNDRSTLFATELVRHMEEASEPTVFFVTIGKSHLVRHLAGPAFTSTIQQLELMGIEAVPVYE